MITEGARCSQCTDCCSAPLIASHITFRNSLHVGLFRSCSVSILSRNRYLIDMVTVARLFIVFVSSFVFFVKSILVKHKYSSSAFVEKSPQLNYGTLDNNLMAFILAVVLFMQWVVHRLITFHFNETWCGKHKTTMADTMEIWPCLYAYWILWIYFDPVDSCCNVKTCLLTFSNWLYDQS